MYLCVKNLLKMILSRQKSCILYLIYVRFVERPCKPLRRCTTNGPDTVNIAYKIILV